MVTTRLWGPGGSPAGPVSGEQTPLRPLRLALYPLRAGRHSRRPQPDAAQVHDDEHEGRDEGRNRGGGGGTADGQAGR